MDEMNKLEVIIDGKVFVLHGTESDEYFQKLGRYIDKKITDAKKVKPITASGFDLSSLYILVNIADDMFKEQTAAVTLQQELDRYVEELTKLTEENLLLRDKLSECQINYNNARKELNEYIEAFDEKNKK